MPTTPIRKETLVLTKEGGDTITGDLRYRIDGKNAAIVVVCHSFMAFKDWGFFPHLSARIAEACFATFAFNFSWDGVIGSANRITEFERFQQNLFSKELSDCERIIDAIRSGEIAAEDGKNFRNVPLIFMGHSRGGGMSVLTASRHDEVSGLITMAAVSTFNRWTDHQKSQWRAQGFLPLSRGTAASPMKLGIGLLNELEERSDEYNLLRAAGKLSIPWLLIHGTNDMMVKYPEAEALYAASDKSKTELLPLEHAGHMFKAASPTEDGYETLDHTIEIITSWLHKHF